MSSEHNELCARFVTQNPKTGHCWKDMQPLELVSSDMHRFATSSFVMQLPPRLLYIIDHEILSWRPETRPYSASCKVRQ
jgi:hypothetical protein